MTRLTPMARWTMFTSLLGAFSGCQPGPEGETRGPRPAGRTAPTGELRDGRYAVDTGGTGGGDGGGEGEESGSGPARLTDPLSGMVFRRIEPSSFAMGCTPRQEGSCSENERPAMPVTLTYPHYIAETEVTQAQFEAAMGYNPSYHIGRDDRPAENFTWHEAAALSNVLSTGAGLSPCYTCTGSGPEVACTAPADLLACEGYRLPTEAEWEGAARCGADTFWAGGDDDSDVGWTEWSGFGETEQVALLSPNFCQLFDMTGNVWEWVNDWYAADAYTAAGSTDPTGPTSGSEHVIRSGSYSGEPWEAQVSTRYGELSGPNSRDRGVRLARTAP